MPSHCLLAFMISNEKSAVNLTEELLYLMSHFSHCLLDSFFVFDLPQFEYAVFRYRSLSLSYLQFIELLRCVD